MKRSGFTIVELLIGVGILVVLSTITIVAINPAELFRQSRDSNRLSALDSLNMALTMYSGSIGGSLGTASTTYVSIPSTVSDCSNLGLPTPPPTYAYKCVTAENLRKVDGNGWVPINFTSLSSGAPFDSLPIDPKNTTTTDLYYTYSAGEGWALSSLLESEKHLRDKAVNDGGFDPGRYEVGTELSLIAKNQGLAGWWRMDEGSGSVATDSSKTGNTGTWNGTGTRYSTMAKVGTHSGQFNGIDDFIDLGNPNSLKITGNQSILMWLYPTNSSARRNPYGKAYGGEGTITFEIGGGFNYYYGTGGGNTTPYQGFNANFTIPLNTWSNVALTRNLTAMRLNWFLDGASRNSVTASYSAAVASNLNAFIGQAYTARFMGQIDEMRVYSRALTPSEINAIYKATK